MRYYFAPMEGITLYPLRNIHHEMFGDHIDKYYTPFLTAHHNFHFKKREKRDVQPEFIQGFEDYGNEIVPQIMANRADTFIWAARQMKELGYNEVNLNLGCPAATVTNSHKGSGLLLDVDYLDELLDGIFTGLSEDDLDISLKTRLGFSDPSEADDIMKVYARYPAKELTIHARVREDFYKGEPRIEDFKRAATVYRANGGTADICYNGNVFSVLDMSKLQTVVLDNMCSDNCESTNENNSDISAIMLGRGLLSNPALARELSGGEGLKADELKEYLSRLYAEYATYIPEERNVIFKMLEHWAFLHVHFEDCEKNLKNIRKARSKGEYFAAVNAMFHDCKFTCISAC